MWVSASLVILMLTAAALIAWACFLARDFAAEAGDWRREIRKYRRKILGGTPVRERLPLTDKALTALRLLDRDFASWHRAVEDLTDGQEIFEQRIRREIDQLAGKAVYHGLKEQL